MTNVYSLKDWKKESLKIVEAFSGFFYLIGYVIMLISALLLFAVQLRNIELWRREIGTLLAFGYPRKSLLKTFILQALLLTILALISYAIAYPIDITRMEHNLSALAVKLSPDWQFLGMFSVAMFIVLVIAVIFSIARILRTSIVQLLEEE